jgi:hypothetical protein
MPDCHKPPSANALRIVADPISHPIPTDTCQTDPDLAAVVNAWDGLPEAVRASILMLVKAAPKR